MSVTIDEIMKLPSMKEAKIVAGNTENKIISSITVLEAHDSNIVVNRNINNSYKSEIAITAFMNSRDSIEKQCEAIMRLHEEGEVGVIVYYIGLIIPKLDNVLLI